MGLVFKVNCNHFHAVLEEVECLPLFEFLVASKGASVSSVLRISVASCDIIVERSSVDWLIVFILHKAKTAPLS